MDSTRRKHFRRLPLWAIGCGFNFSEWHYYLRLDFLFYSVSGFSKYGMNYLLGQVSIYELLNNEWKKLGNDINVNASSQDCGFSISLSSEGKTIAIGSPSIMGRDSDSGEVRIFKFLEGIWSQQGSTIEGEKSGDKSGWSVGLSSDGLTVAIGSISNAGNGGIDRGHVRVYKFVGEDWLKQGSDIAGETNTDHFGYSVSLSSNGSTLAVGIPGSVGGGEGEEGQPNYLG